MSSDDAAARVGKVFEEIAEDYDQSGVAFFGPIAEGLVGLLDLTPGERVVDVGCGRGALTLPAARAVGETGRVTAVDIAPAMVDLTRRAAADAALPQVDTAVVTADALGLPEASADVVASSLVLFFAPDPLATLEAWLRLLVAGGRIGISTFGDPDETWQQVERLFHPYLPPALLDARTSGRSGAFASDAGVEQLFADAGAHDVLTTRRALEVHFPDAEAWRRFSMSTGQRAFWRFVPEERREPLFHEAAELLEQARADDGDVVLVQDVRYTLARRPAPA
jgi:ubiquinone/menaquinone biosynthesis C-methylase UbiE